MTTYFGILTRVGEAKEANAKALGVPLHIAELEVGDGGGNVPTPNREQAAMIGSQRRAPVNRVFVDPKNPSWLVIEQVIPESVGGFWIRELGLRDGDGDLIAVSNCPPTYKPLLAEGSGRTQVVRMVLMVSSATNWTLKIDPAVVLATRGYVEDVATTRLGKEETAKAAEKLATGRNISISGPLVAKGVSFDGSKAISLKLDGIEQGSILVGNGEQPLRALSPAQAREHLGVPDSVPQRIVITASNQSWPIPPELRGQWVDAFLIGGGAGGGGGAAGHTTWGGGGGGGGGPGEWQLFRVQLPDADTLPVTIGTPGKGGAAGGNAGSNGTSGGVTSLGSLASVSGGQPGGGAGGSSYTGRPFPGTAGPGAVTGSPGAVTTDSGISGNGGSGGNSALGRGGEGGYRAGHSGALAGSGQVSPDANSGAGGGGGGGGLGNNVVGGAGGDGSAGRIIIERA
ncbi:phage tail protein [Bordetella avium]|uniref:phage tail protein n=1 Tax=Bordetella avium TaxID=521 RepID=UPI001F38B478|nr:phage tail protein [Bordetella avium]